MGIIDFFRRKGSQPITTEQVRQQIQRGVMTEMVNSGRAVYGPDNVQSQVDRYATVDDVYSVIRLIAKTASTIPVRVYKKKNEQKAREYAYATKQRAFDTRSLLKRQLLKAQAFEEVPESDKLQMLIDRPNDLFTGNEQREGFSVFRLLSGNAYLYAPKIDLGVNAGKIVELFLMPSQYTTPKVSGTFPQYITGYEMNLNGVVPFDKDSVLHSRYFNPNYTTDGQELVGISPLRSLHKVVTRSASENDFMTRGFQNAGAQGIVWFKGMDEESTDSLGKLKSDFYAEGSGSFNARKNLFMGYEAGYTQIGLSPVDMDVINSQKFTFKRICNAYGVSDILFNNGEASTESNVKEMIKRLYTNAALPEAYAYRDILNKHIAPLFGSEYFIDVDITGITELQDDMKQMAEIFSTLPVMIPNLIFEAFNYGKIDDTLMDKVYIKSGYEPIENVQQIPDITGTGDYGTQSGT